MTRSERVAVRRDIRRRRTTTRQHHLGMTPHHRERTTTMDVTITVHRFVTLTPADRLEIEETGLKVTQGIGSLFIEGDLDTAAEFARRFTTQEA